MVDAEPDAKAAAQTPRVRVGIAGWVFPPWRGTFYPKGLRQASELDYASRHVTSIEINGTFYGAQKPASFRRWRDETPDDFVFSVKGTRYATHRRVLAESASSVERFFESGVGELGAILWQFPATTKYDQANFAAFLELLPAKLDGRKLRHVLEVRHDSFADPGFAKLLAKHNVALALIDAENQTAFDEATADFAYVRLKRAAEDVPTGYMPKALDGWIARAKTIAKTRDCFVYVINGAKVRAPAGAMALIERLRK
jgi:uncharacterized protein YecE (DUF72 family)